MRKFVVAYLDFFENVIKMETVKANNTVDALKKSSFLEGWDFPKNWTEEDIQNAVFSNDAAISVIEI